MPSSGFAETFRSQALLSRQLFQTHDPDEARSRVGEVLSPHELRVLDTGDAVDTRMYRVTLGSISLHRLSYGAAVEVRPGRMENAYLVQMPISGSCVVRCGDTTVDSSPGVGTVVTPTEPLHLLGHKGCDQIIVQIDRSLLERHCGQHLGRDLSKPVKFAPRMALDGSQIEPWRRLIELLVSEAAHDSGMLASPAARSNLEQMLVSALLFGQSNSLSDELRRPTPPLAPYYVRRAEEYIHAHAGEQVSIADVAEHAGVSISALYSGFKNFRDTSPAALLKSIRLQRVRAELLEGASRDETVTGVAMRWGFTHLGHFTAAYKHKFGEAPSQTLRRSIR